jgi:hypothetical protein
MRIQEAQKHIRILRIRNTGKQIFVLILCTIPDTALSGNPDSSVSEDAGIEPRTVAKVVLGN